MVVTCWSIVILSRITTIWLAITAAYALMMPALYVLVALPMAFVVPSYHFPLNYQSEAERFADEKLLKLCDEVEAESRANKGASSALDSLISTCQEIDATKMFVLVVLTFNAMFFVRQYVIEGDQFSERVVLQWSGGLVPYLLYMPGPNPNLNLTLTWP